MTAAFVIDQRIDLHLIFVDRPKIIRLEAVYPCSPEEHSVCCHIIVDLGKRSRCFVCDSYQNRVGYYLLRFFVSDETAVECYMLSVESGVDLLR